MIPSAERPFPVYRRFLPGERTPWGVMHVVNRVAGGQFLLGPEEKDHFRSLVFRAAAFCGLEVLTWTCLDNHFHLLLVVPNEAEAQRLREGVTEEDLFERMKPCFSAQYIRETRWRLEKFRSTPGLEPLADTIIRRLKAQLFDISNYMHMVQRRFSVWYNGKHGRRGTLWEGRFRSTLIEESGEALARCAAYIDLNAVRAGIVKDPADYRWCGYAEAVRGDRKALSGLVSLRKACLEQEERPNIGEALAFHRDRLLEPLQGPSAEDNPGDRSIKPTRSPAALLRCRVRYFTASLAIGSRRFCEDVFQRYRSNFGPRRTTAARPLRHGNWAGLCGLRDLRKEAVSSPRAQPPPENR